MSAREVPFVNFSMTRGHVCNGDKYGRVVKDFRTSSLGPNALGFKRVKDAHVVYPSVGARRVMLNTLSGIASFRAISSGPSIVALYGRSNRPLVALRGGTTPRISLSSLSKR